MGRGAWNCRPAGWKKCRRTIRASLAFFTGRDQSQSLTGWWASQVRHAEPRRPRRLLFGQHGGAGPVHHRRIVLGVRRARLGTTRYFMMFGVAEDHDSNPIKMGLAKLKGREGAKFVSVNPVRTGYSAIADEWIGIRPVPTGCSCWR
jgi:hypothetical protein